MKNPDGILHRVENDDFDYDNATVEEYEAMILTRLKEGRDAARAASDEGSSTADYFALYEVYDDLYAKFCVAGFRAFREGKVPPLHQAQIAGSIVGTMFGSYLKNVQFFEGVVFQQAFSECSNTIITGKVPEGVIVTEVPDRH